MPLAVANHSFVPAIPLDIIRLSRPSLRMPLAVANHSFIPAIPLDIIRLSQSSLRMPLAEANQLFTFKHLTVWYLN
jgi:hypothetical protein